MTTLATMPPEPAVDRLRRVADALAAGEPPPADDAAWLGRGLAGWLAADQPLDAALALPWGWRRDARHAERDALLRELAQGYTGTVRARALALQAELQHYAGVNWPRERHLPQMPDSASSRRRLLHRLFRLDPAPPTSLRRLVEVCNSWG